MDVAFYITRIVHIKESNKNKNFYYKVNKYLIKYIANVAKVK